MNVEFTDEGLSKENLQKLSKEELIDLILLKKHTMIQQKNKNIPFLDEKGTIHKKQFGGRK